MITTELITQFSKLEPLRGEWNALAAQSVTSTPFQLFEWHSCWWEAFGSEHELLVILVRRNGELVGIAPLTISVQRMNLLPERVLSFMGSVNYASDYADFLIRLGDDEVLNSIFQIILKERNHWSAINFSNIPDRSPHIPKITELLGAKYLPHSEVSGPCPAIDLSDETAAKKLTRKQSLKRHYNHFSKNGRLLFKRIISRKEISPYLEQLFSQHIKRREFAADRSQFLDPKQCLFYRLLIGRMPEEILHFSVVLFNDKPIAIHFGFEMERIFYWYKPSFDIDYAKYGPGEVLLKFLLEHAIDSGLREFDFTFGDEAFKYRFANVARNNFRFTAHSRFISKLVARGRHYGNKERVQPSRNLL